MSANKGKGTRLELLFGKLLWNAGIRYRKNDSTIVGKPDFVIRKMKIAIFCDGEFWHGRNWETRKGDHKSNCEFWYSKIERNIERDKEVNEQLKDLVKKVSEINPLQFNPERAFSIYAYKVKNLLTSVALGLIPKKAWDGRCDANGGYMVIKESGDILCYHFYDRNRFEDYLFSNVYLERSSTSRHKYATIIKDAEGKLIFKLNLQVRLK